MDRRTVIALVSGALLATACGGGAGAAGGASTPSGGGDGATTAADARAREGAEAGPARSSCRARRRPPSHGPFSFDGRYTVRFEQIAPEDPNLDFATQTAFVATLDRTAAAGGRGHGPPVPRRRPHRPQGRSRRTAAYYVDVSFGDFPYAVRFTPASRRVRVLRAWRT